MADETKPVELKFAGDAWEQQPNETPQAFEAFANYRDAGPKRSTAKTARSLRKSKQLMDGWSSKWKWVRRCELFDQQQQREYLSELAEARKEMAKRQAANGLYLQQLAMKALKKKYGENFEKITPKVLQNGEFLKFLMDGAKLERVALGAPDSIQEQQHNAGIIESGDRKPIIPVTFAGRIEDALALLETARARQADGAAGPAD